MRKCLFFITRIRIIFTEVKVSELYELTRNWQQNYLKYEIISV
jgi:hypothetical protein